MMARQLPDEQPSRKSRRLRKSTQKADDATTATVKTKKKSSTTANSKHQVNALIASTSKSATSTKTFKKGAGAKKKPNAKEQSQPKKPAKAATGDDGDGDEEDDDEDDDGDCGPNTDVNNTVGEVSKKGLPVSIKFTVKGSKASATDQVKSTISKAIKSSRAKDTHLSADTGSSNGNVSAKDTNDTLSRDAVASDTSRIPGEELDSQNGEEASQKGNTPAESSTEAGQASKTQLQIVTVQSSADSERFVSAGDVFQHLFPPNVHEVMTDIQKDTVLPQKAVAFGIANESNHSYRNAVLMALLHSPAFFRLVTRNKLDSKYVNASNPQPANRIMEHMFKMLVELQSDETSSLDREKKKQLAASKAVQLTELVQTFWTKFCFPADGDSTLLPTPPNTLNNYAAAHSDDQQIDAKLFLQWLFNAIQAQLFDIDGDLIEKLKFDMRLYRQVRQVCVRCQYRVALREKDSQDDYIYSIKVPKSKPKSKYQTADEAKQTSVPLEKLFAESLKVKIGKSRRRKTCEKACKDEKNPCAKCKKYETCPRCKKSLQSDSYTEHKIGHLPDMMVIHLDRRSSSKPAGNHSLRSKGIEKKNTLAVTIPKIFNVTEHLDPVRFGKASKMVRYSLSTIVSHKGTDLSNGHYVAWIQKSGFEDWYKLDDDKEAEYWLQTALIDARTVPSNPNTWLPDVHGSVRADVTELDVQKLRPDQFEARETPVLLFYERMNDNYEKIAKGRDPRNAEEGLEEDVDPLEKDEVYPTPDSSPVIERSPVKRSNWQTLPELERANEENKMTEISRKKADEFYDNIVSRQNVEKNMADFEAVMEVSITIGGKVYQFSPTKVDNINRFKHQDIDINITADQEISLQPNETGKKLRRINLTDAYHDQLRWDEELEKKLHAEKRLQKRKRDQEELGGDALIRRVEEDERCLKRRRRQLASSDRRDERWADQWYDMGKNPQQSRNMDVSMRRQDEPVLADGEDSPMSPVSAPFDVQTQRPDGSNNAGENVLTCTAGSSTVREEGRDDGAGGSAIASELPTEIGATPSSDHGILDD